MFYMVCMLLLIAGVVIGLCIVLKNNDSTLGIQIIMVVTALMCLVAFPIIAIILIAIGFIYYKYAKKKTDG